MLAGISRMTLPGYAAGRFGLHCTPSPASAYLDLGVREDGMTAATPAATDGGISPSAAGSSLVGFVAIIHLLSREIPAYADPHKTP